MIQILSNQRDFQDCVNLEKLVTTETKSAFGALHSNILSDFQAGRVEAISFVLRYEFQQLLLLLHTERRLQFVNGAQVEQQAIVKGFARIF